MYVIKKDGTNEDFNVQKIIVAVNKSAARILYKLDENSRERRKGAGENQRGSIPKCLIHLKAHRGTHGHTKSVHHPKHAHTRSHAVARKQGCEP